MMQFAGGKDSRVSTKPKTAACSSGSSSDDDNKVHKLPSRRPAMREGTYSHASLTMHPDGSWTSDESGGHVFRSSRVSNSTKSSGTYTKSPDSTTFAFTVVEFEQHSSDKRCPVKDGKGQVILRKVDDIQSGNFKSFFYEIDLEKKQ